jgi:hypothetical protein
LIDYLIASGLIDNPDNMPEEVENIILASAKKYITERNEGLKG